MCIGETLEDSYHSIQPYLGDISPGWKETARDKNKISISSDGLKSLLLSPPVLQVEKP